MTIEEIITALQTLRSKRPRFYIEPALRISSSENYVVSFYLTSVNDSHVFTANSPRQALYEAAEFLDNYEDNIREVYETQLAELKKRFGMKD